MQVTVILLMFSDSRKYVNRLPLIRRCLISLKNQSCKDFNIIGIDNNSYDDVKSLFLSYFPNSSLYNCDKLKNRAAARNLGASFVNTPYIIFLDSDCIAFPTYIQNYLYYINKKYLVIQGAFYSYWKYLFLQQEFIKKEDNKEILDYEALEKVNTLVKEFRGYRPTSIYQDNLKEELLFDCNSIFSGNFCISKQTFDSVGGFDEDFVGYGYEDAMLGEVIKFNNIKIYGVLNTSVIHQNHRSDKDPSHVEDCEDASKNKKLLENKVKELISLRRK